MATASPPPAPVLAGRYRLDKRIATGGMAEVWLATDQLLSREVAVKLLKPTLAADPVIAERFRREAISVARLTHPNVVAIHDTVDDGGRQAVVMQLVIGDSLREVLDRERKLSPERTIQVGAAVAAALGAAHEAELVHRDVKPGNILITRDGRVLLTDFGIAKAAGEGDLTSDNVMMGTAKYLSPEQVRGRRLDGRADLYSLGLVLYECLAGRVPFQADTDAATALARLQRDPTPLGRLRPTLPPGLVELIHRLLARNPEDRPASSAVVQATLERILAEPPIELPATVPTPRPSPPPAPRQPNPAPPTRSTTPPGAGAPPSTPPPSTPPPSTPTGAGAGAPAGTASQPARPAAPASGIAAPGSSRPAVLPQQSAGATPHPTGDPATRTQPASGPAAAGPTTPAGPPGQRPAATAGPGGGPTRGTPAGGAPGRASDGDPAARSGQPAGAATPPIGTPAARRTGSTTSPRTAPSTDATPRHVGAAAASSAPTSVTGGGPRPGTPGRPGQSGAGGVSGGRPTGSRPIPRPDGAHSTPPSGSLHGRPARQFQQRWAPSLVVVGGLLVIALVIGVILASSLGGGTKSTVPPVTNTPPVVVSVTPATTVLDDGVPAALDLVTGFRVFDPRSDGSENDELLPSIADGSEAQAWYTECYQNRHMGGQEGVGVIVPLTRPSTGTLTVTFVSPRWAAKLYGGNSIGSDLAGWGSPLTATYSQTEVTAAFDLGPRPVQYLMLWLTELPDDPSNVCSDNNPYRGGIAELSLTPTSA